MTEFYFTGRPCRRGHIAPRYVSVGLCCACVAMHNKAQTYPAKYERNKVWRAKYRNSWEKQWRTENPEKWRASKQRARIKRKRKEGFTAAQLKQIFKMQRGRCAYCRQKLENVYHVDHIEPLARGGSNLANNIQLTCESCNLRKHVKDPLVYAREIGCLL